MMRSTTGGALLGAVLGFPMFLFGMAGIPFHLHEGGFGTALKVMLVLGMLLQVAIATGLGRWAVDEAPGETSLRRPIAAYLSFWAALLGVTSFFIIFGGPEGQVLRTALANLAQSAAAGIPALVAAAVSGHYRRGVRLITPLPQPIADGSE